MLRESRGARRYNDLVTLTRKTVIKDEFGHPHFGEPQPVLDVYAQVRQMSATKSMLTFQQGDVVGIDIEMREPGVVFDGLTWRGHRVYFPAPESVDNRGRIIRISGWYQIDHPVQQPIPPNA